MAAWGFKPHQNDLAKDWLTTLLNTNVYPIILEKVDLTDRENSKIDLALDKDSSDDLTYFPANTLKHKYAYYIDRFRMAVELMIMLDKSGSYSFAKGYYQIVLEKLYICSSKKWTNCWENDQGKNVVSYKEDVWRQIEEVKLLLKKVKD